MSFLSFCSAAIGLTATAWADPKIESHKIDVTLDPATSRITAKDAMRVARDPPGAGGTLTFTLNTSLRITETRVDGRSVPGPRRTGAAPGADGWLDAWTLDVPGGPEGRAAIVEVVYEGTIADQVKKSEDLSFVVGDDTRGVVCPQGVYLSEGSGWYPAGAAMARFDVRALVPEPFVVVTQGTNDPETGWWRGKYAADGLALVAGKWKREERKVGNVLLGTYLTESNAAHATLLLDAVAGYLAKDAELLGPYAYDRFDVVENWFTTGYGMPEFTLLGGDVIARMAAEAKATGAIPSGYLDHEVVHCWWGNLVFPDYASGNWCEGLTTYCANYRSKEEEGADAAREYRRRAALRFALGASPSRDYPVRAFTGKKEDVDDDIGYAKCAMFFHALRRELGDAAFWDTLRRVARERRGTRFSWEDWRAEFERASKRNLAAFFREGLDRRSAPLLGVTLPEVKAEGGRIRVSATLTQTLRADEEPWHLAVPVVVEHLEGVEETIVDSAAAETRFSVLVPSLPLRVTVDPDRHVFRRFAPDEVPPCLAATIARPTRIVVFPDDDAALRAAAEAAASRAGFKAVPASQAPAELPAGTSALVFGDATRVPLLASLRESLPRHFPSSRATPATTVLATARSPADPDEFVTTLTGAPEAVAKRARAVFYYKYDGRVVFEGGAPRERGIVAAANHASRTLLPDVRAAASPDTVRQLVDALAATNGRLAGAPEDKRARSLVASQLTLAGCEVTEQGFRFNVKSLDATRKVLSRESGAVAGAIPLVASPATEQPVAIAGVATDPEGELKGRALLLDLPGGTEDLVAFARGAASLARARGAVALLLRLPEQPTNATDELVSFPDGTAEHPAWRAAAVAARTGAVKELDLPTVAVPHGFDPTGVASVDVGFTIAEIATANIVGRIKLRSSKRAGIVVLGAHHDHLGPGFPGADDDASGVAAVVEAARILVAQSDLLAREVWIVVFGAEEWGLRGSRAFLEAWPKDRPIVAQINADTVGRRGVSEASVVGVTKHPRLANLVAAALDQAAIPVGPDIDRFAFAYGSDHWSFHEAGIPTVDLWSGDYAVMHTAKDTPDGVDEKKVSRVGLALALAALGVAGSF